MNQVAERSDKERSHVEKQLKIIRGEHVEPPPPSPPAPAPPAKMKSTSGMPPMPCVLPSYGVRVGRCSTARTAVLIDTRPRVPAVVKKSTLGDLPLTPGIHTIAHACIRLCSSKASQGGAGRGAGALRQPLLERRVQELRQGARVVQRGMQMERRKESVQAQDHRCVVLGQHVTS